MGTENELQFYEFRRLYAQSMIAKEQMIKSIIDPPSTVCQKQGKMLCFNGLPGML